MREIGRGSFAWVRCGDHTSEVGVEAYVEA
jgi:hypothetical protein